MKHPRTWILVVLLVGLPLSSLSAQSAGAVSEANSSANPAASASSQTVPDAGVTTPMTPVTGGTPLMGTWRVERAIFELFGNLKDVLGQDDRFYGLLQIDAAGKGSIRYGSKTEEVPIEYDYKNGQSLTIAFGSRLKPQVDLYNVLLLGDGGLFLRSTRLAQVNGTIFYLFRKAN